MMVNYFETLNDEELSRDHTQLNMLMQILDQTCLLAKHIHPESLLEDHALSEAKMLFELSDLEIKLREKKKIYQ